VCKKSRGERLQVKGEKQTKQVSNIAKRAAMQSEAAMSIYTMSICT
jgi:hypothetical protein